MNIEMDENSRNLMERVNLSTDLNKIKVMIYLFIRIANNQVNDKNDENPMSTDEEITIFNFESLGYDSSFTENIINHLVGCYSKLTEKKCIVNFTEVEGISYDETDKNIISNYEKLTFKEKLDFIAELLIRLDNQTLFSKDYKIYIDENGYDLAYLIKKVYN